MTDNITISKGGISVTIHTLEINDNYKNTLISFTPPQPKEKQATGPKTTKVIDLLRITHSMKIDGVLTNDTDRNNLITIAKGANTRGGPCSVTYEGYPGSPLSMFLEDLTITEVAREKDAISGNYKYSVQFQLIEGTYVG